MAVNHVGLLGRVVLQELQCSTAEEVEAVGIVVAAVHAAHPEHSIVGLQERCVEALHLPPEHTDMAARIVE